jgi:glycosyltransferase involved in cell wall biosynthesis
MKVCFLAGTLGRGGAERQLVYMLRALKQAGVETRVLCLTKGEPFEAEIRALDIPVEWVGASPSKPMRLKRVINYLRQNPTDILQSAHFYTNLYVATAGRITGITNIGAIRNDLISEVKSHGLLGRWQLTLPGHLIANSDLARQRAITRGISPERIDLVRNVVEMRGGTKRNGYPSAPIRILFAGRLVAQKRPERFLRIMSSVMQRIPNQPLKAVIAGDGPMRPELESLAKSLGMGNEKLEFLGTCSDMNALYHGADLLVLTSEHEGTPNVLLEAMACGLPVVATNVGGVSEILSSDRGLIVEADNEVALTSAVLRLVGDAHLRAQLGLRGREYVERTHSLVSLHRQLTNIYQRILS